MSKIKRVWLSSNAKTAYAAFELAYGDVFVTIHDGSTTVDLDLHVVEIDKLIKLLNKAKQAQQSTDDDDLPF